MGEEVAVENYLAVAAVLGTLVLLQLISKSKMP